MDPMPTWNPQLWAAGASCALSLALDRAPGLKGVWNRLDETQKKAAMSGLLIAVALGSVFWNCTGEGGVALCLTETDWRVWASTLLAALINQPFHDLTKKGGGEGGTP